tara:strand:+ start:15 stop:683 length:669 start_codon:yes stop_codon:yes gene_type:complete
MQIYISRDGEQNGPYGIEDVNAYLEDGTLLPTDLACQDGMTEWVPISQIPGVTISGDSVETPIPPSQPVPNGNKKKILIGIGVGMGLLALMVGIWFFFIREAGDKEQLSENKENNSTAAKPVKELTLEDVVGTYEAKKDGRTEGVIFLENGVIESYENGKKRELEAKWTIINGEIHGEVKNGRILVFSINKDKSVTNIAVIDKDGEREDFPEESLVPLKNIK